MDLPLREIHTTPFYQHYLPSEDQKKQISLSILQHSFAEWLDTPLICVSAHNLSYPGFSIMYKKI